MNNQAPRSTSGLRYNEDGFVVAGGYSTIDLQELRQSTGAQPNEVVYQTTTEAGARVSHPISSDKITVKPGDTFSPGPQVIRAGGEISEPVRKEFRILKSAGYGMVSNPERTNFGFTILLNGFTLPGGIRTKAMILLPLNYPMVGPIGFYVHQSGVRAIQVSGAAMTHLFPDKTYYGAPNLSDAAAGGWAWFCMKFEPWIPGRYTLLTVMQMVGSQLSTTRSGQ